jgi:hypothetical protein
MPSHEGVPTLSLDELREMAELQCENLQRKVNQGVLKNDLQQGICALGGVEAVKEFIRICEQRVGMYAQHEARIAERRAKRKPGHNITTLPPSSPAVRKRVKTGVPVEDQPAWSTERKKA